MPPGNGLGNGPSDYRLMVDSDKIEATFEKGVLTVTMPKKPEMQKNEKKIGIKAA